MPVAFEKSIKEGLTFLLWKIKESEEELLERLHLDEVEFNDFNSLKIPVRRLEWLGARNALKVLLKEYGQFFHYKDKYGKPHLRDSSIGVSMSHANGFGGAVINLNGPVGLDIEWVRPQIGRIAKKFTNSPEANWASADETKLTQIWAAKEALYKLHGRTQLAFAEQLLLNINEDKVPSNGDILENGIKENFQLRFGEWESLHLCIAF